MQSIWCLRTCKKTKPSFLRRVVDRQLIHQTINWSTQWLCWNWLWMETTTWSRSRWQLLCLRSKSMLIYFAVYLKRKTVSIFSASTKSQVNFQLSPASFTISWLIVLPLKKVNSSKMCSNMFLCRIHQRLVSSAEAALPTFKSTSSGSHRV